MDRHAPGPDADNPCEHNVADSVGRKGLGGGDQRRSHVETIGGRVEDAFNTLLALNQVRDLHVRHGQLGPNGRGRAVLQLDEGALTDDSRDHPGLGRHGRCGATSCGQHPGGQREAHGVGDQRFGDTLGLFAAHDKPQARNMGVGLPRWIGRIDAAGTAVHLGHRRQGVCQAPGQGAGGQNPDVSQIADLDSDVLRVDPRLSLAVARRDHNNGVSTQRIEQQRRQASDIGFRRDVLDAAVPHDGTLLAHRLFACPWSRQS
jgi:hypothetical protein